MSSLPTPSEQLQILRRGTDGIVPEEDLLKKLESSAVTGRPLQVKLGLDPTAPDIHLGLAVVLRKLRQFQDLGHVATIIIGDFTAMIGDPSGKSLTRKQLSMDEVRDNARTYEEQYTKILDPAKTKVTFNSQWLGALSFHDVILLTAHVTVARVLERDDFANRLAQNRPLSLHELLYPISQAYDSVELRSDVELGGTDQRFNILMGRDLQREYGQEPQVALFTPLLVGLDGVQKMSKSLGNYVGVSEPAETQFAKLLSISDDLMPKYYELCTELPESTYAPLIAQQPMEAKKRLAVEVISYFHSSEAALHARAEWERVHSQHQLPDEVPDVDVSRSQLKEGRIWVVSLVKALLSCGTNEARRHVQNKAVALEGAKVTEVDAQVEVKGGEVLQVGRRHFGRIRLVD